MTLIIAEVGSNFVPGDIVSAREMIHIAADCGADIVKFQDWRVDNMNRPQWWRDKCRPWEIRGWVLDLCAEASALGIGFLCSVWDYQSIDIAFQWYDGLVKVASSEIGNQQLLRRISKKSTKYWLWNDIEERPVNILLSVDYRAHAKVIPALTWLPDCAVTLLHTVADYPAESSKMDALEDLKEFGLPVGYSNHCPYPLAASACADAVALGAEVVEMHLRTVDTPLKCPDNGPWAMYPNEFVEIVKEIKNAERNK